MYSVIESTWTAELSLLRSCECVCDKIGRFCEFWQPFKRSHCNTDNEWLSDWHETT